MGKMKQETPLCDGCACRDDELEKMRGELSDLRARFGQEIRFYTEGKSTLYESEINRLKALIIDVLRCRVQEPFKGWDITKLNRWVEDVTTSPAIERHCDTCHHNGSNNPHCDGCISYTKYHNWKTKE